MLYNILETDKVDNVWMLNLNYIKTVELICKLNRKREVIEEANNTQACLKFNSIWLSYK